MTDYIQREHLFHQPGKLRILAVDVYEEDIFPSQICIVLNSPLIPDILCSVEVAPLPPSSFCKCECARIQTSFKKNNLNPSNSPVWKMFIQFVTEKPKALLKTAKIFC